MSKVWTAIIGVILWPIAIAALTIFIIYKCRHRIAAIDSR
jgi:hypothetical protein